MFECKLEGHMVTSRCETWIKELEEQANDLSAVEAYNKSCLQYMYMYMRERL